MLIPMPTVFFIRTTLSQVTGISIEPGYLQLPIAFKFLKFGISERESYTIYETGPRTFMLQPGGTYK